MQINEVIGERCSIVSKSGVRYVGTLIGVETKDKMLTFSNVSSFGTENRNVSAFIPPDTGIYGTIVFNSEDIDSFHIVREAVKEPPSHSIFNDPAIVQAKSKVDSQNNNQNSQQNDKRNQSNQRPVNNVNNQRNNYNKTAFIDPNAPSENKNRNSSTSSYYNNSNSRGYRNSQNNQQDEPLPEFDFAKSITEFNKEPVGGFTESADDSNASKKDYYDKTTSFFDTISCDALKSNDDEAIRERRRKMMQERQINMETFGEASVQTNTYARFNIHRGRGRGGRGGYRGRGGNPRSS